MHMSAHTISLPPAEMDRNDGHTHPGPLQLAYGLGLVFSQAKFTHPWICKSREHESIGSLKEVSKFVFLVDMGITMCGEKVSVMIDLIFPCREGDGRGSQAYAGAQGREAGVSANCE